MILIYSKTENKDRIALIRKYTKSKWTFYSFDFNNVQLLNKLKNCDAVITMKWNYDTKHFPKLKLIQLPGAGFDKINFDKINPNISVCNVYEHEIPISEYVISSILQWLINIPKIHQKFNKFNWYGSYINGPVHSEVYSKTLLIIGYGRIGRETAKKAKAFGMIVNAYTKPETRKDKLIDNFFSGNQIHFCLKNADFILISLPLNDKTFEFIDKNKLSRLKKTCVIINVSRAEIIKEEDLFNALKEKTIGGAIIDVWYKYPKKNSKNVKPSNFPFDTLNNVIMTPHVSAWTDNLQIRRAKLISMNLDRLMLNKNLINKVN